MGVERFFSSLKRDYNFIQNASKKIECEHVLIDFNSIVHVTSQFLLEHVNKIKDIQIESKEEFEIKLIEKVGVYIIDLIITQFYADKIVSISIEVDGVPSMSKIFEQKKRRYMGDLISHLTASHSNSFSWSRNNISPGTDFMRNMMTFLNSTKFKDDIEHECTHLKHYNVSGIDVVGEGEIKILHVIHKMIQTKYKYDRFVVYSPDSDVIILLLMMNVNVIMLRYDQQESSERNPVYSTVDINQFKTILYDYVSNKTTKKLNKINVIMDIVFILTVFGDDFLPKLETVRVNTDINLLIDHYVFIVLNYGYICDTANIANKGKGDVSAYSINTNTFLQFLTLLRKKEDYFLKRNARYHVSTNYSRIESDIVGYMMHTIRDLLIEYIWKFIYLHKPKDVQISPINAHEHISVTLLTKYMNKVESRVDMNTLSMFSKHEFKNTLVWDKMLHIISGYYIEILHYMDIKSMKNNKLYDTEVSYVESLPVQLLKDIITYFYLTYEMPFTIPLKTSHDKILFATFNSSDNPHRSRMQRLVDGEKELYKIDNKLDDYYKILNPKDKFYSDIYNNINGPINYSTYYTTHFPHEKINTIVSDYLSGFNWIISYYHNTNDMYNNIDLTWYYRHNRSPLLKDIITMYDPSILTNHMPIKLDLLSYMTPLEHYIFVSPFNLEKDLTDQLIKLVGSMTSDEIKMLVRFINTYHKYYYQLTKIYNDMKTNRLIDCSSSIFISKCHLLFMENYVDMHQFILDFRKAFKYSKMK